MSKNIINYNTIKKTNRHKNFMVRRHKKPLHKRMMDEEDIKYDITKLENKYNNLQNDTQTNPYAKLLQTKDDMINILKDEIEDLKNKLTERAIEYNKKLENLRTEHKNEMASHHKKYIKKLQQYNINQTNNTE